MRRFLINTMRRFLVNVCIILFVMQIHAGDDNHEDGVECIKDIVFRDTRENVTVVNTMQYVESYSDLRLSNAMQNACVKIYEDCDDDSLKALAIESVNKCIGMRGLTIESLHTM